MNIPHLMKAAVAHDFDDIRTERIQVPTPGPREALVKVHALGLCTGDVTPWYVHKKCPTVLGHEPAGEIVEIGQEVEKFSVGDRVYFHHHAPCLKCRQCQRGNYSMCQTWRNTKIIPGGAAQYVLIPQDNLEKDTLILPDSMSYDAATLIEPVACVIRAFQRARMIRTDRVAIMGMGVMGQMMAIMAKHLGADLVIGSDMVDWRLQRGLQNGLDIAVNIKDKSFPEAVKEATDGEGADIVMVCPTKPAAVLEGIECAGRASRVLMFMGPQPGTPLTIDMNKVYFDEIDLISSYSSGPKETMEALRLISAGVFTVEKLVTHHFPLEKMHDAILLTRKAQDSLKCIIDID